MLNLRQQTAKFDLAWNFRETTNGLAGKIEYATDLFVADTIERMASHFSILITQVIAAPDKKIQTISLLSQQEYQQILIDWNQTHQNFPADKTIPELFHQQVTKTPENVAVIFEDNCLTYRELDERSNQLGHHLKNLGVRTGALVAIMLERSVEMIVSLLAILKTGAAYLPLDPEYPQQRLTYMLADSQASLLISQSYLLKQIPKIKVKTIHLDKEWNNISQCSKQTATTTISAEDNAYVIYTSGSTGQPKGVILSHRGLINYLTWRQQKTPLTSQDKVLQKTPISFDVSVWELFWPLITGAQLILAKPGGHRDSSYLVELIKQNNI
ncbi:unnamed protein product, partial [marine sediment metagenome]